MFYWLLLVRMLILHIVVPISLLSTTTHAGDQNNAVVVSAVVYDA